MNKKIITGVALTTLLATGLTGVYASENISSSNSKKTKVELTAEQKTILEKKRTGETLTSDEQAKIEGLKIGKGKGKSGKGFGKIMTEEEKAKFELMTAEEKQKFIETKKSELDTKRKSQETVIDKLLNKQTLTADEELVRQEIIKERAERKTKKTVNNIN